MEIRDLNPCPQRPPHERRVEWFPPAFFTHTCIGRMEWPPPLLEELGASGPWVDIPGEKSIPSLLLGYCETGLAVEGVRDAASGERYVRMHKFQSIKRVSFSTCRYVWQLGATATTTESYQMTSQFKLQRTSRIWLEFWNSRRSQGAIFP